MKFALANSNKIEASKGAKGICPSCGSELIAKCGEIKIHHWAHKGTRNCDIWWENETEWHRSWKNQFPVEWQEIVHFDKTGEKHIADVRTESGWVLEFQHSYLKPEERLSRNSFYKKIIWVVDGLRLEKDKEIFRKLIQESTAPLSKMPMIRKIISPEKCKMLRDWFNCGVPVFFDFRSANDTEGSPLWLLLPNVSNSTAYLTRYSRKEFIELHNNKNNEFEDFIFGLLPQIKTHLTKNEQSHSSNNNHLNRGYLRPKRNRRF